MIKLHPPRLFYCQHPLFTPEKNGIMEIKLLFEKAVAATNSMNLQLANETVLQLYSLYKQATKGDIDMPQPVHSFDFITKAKYDAWASLKGKSTTDAQREFITLVNKLGN